MRDLYFLRPDVFGLKLREPSIQVLTASSPPYVMSGIDRRMGAKRQCYGVTGPGVNRAHDTFIFQEDRSIVRAAFDIGEDDALGLGAEMFSEALDEMMAHGQWRDRGI